MNGKKSDNSTDNKKQEKVSLSKEYEMRRRAMYAKVKGSVKGDDEYDS